MPYLNRHTRFFFSLIAARRIAFGGPSSTIYRDPLPYPMATARSHEPLVADTTTDTTVALFVALEQFVALLFIEALIMVREGSSRTASTPSMDLGSSLQVAYGDMANASKLELFLEELSDVFSDDEDNNVPTATSNNTGSCDRNLSDAALRSGQGRDDLKERRPSSGVQS
jgi:hypothetical protein